MNNSTFSVNFVCMHIFTGKVMTCLNTGSNQKVTLLRYTATGGLNIHLPICSKSLLYWIFRLIKFLRLIPYRKCLKYGNSLTFPIINSSVHNLAAMKMF